MSVATVLKETPAVPYVFQSGKHQGQCVELLMFQNYPWLSWMLGKMWAKSLPFSQKNSLHCHLEWLLLRGEDRAPKMLCPQCGINPVEIFSALGDERFGYSIGPQYTCCGHPECQRKLIALAWEKSPAFLPVKFSSILNFRKKFDQRQVVELLKKIYGLDGRITTQKAFDFFSAP